MKNAILIFLVIFLGCKDDIKVVNKIIQPTNRIESFENKLPYNYTQIEQYYTYDSSADFYIIKKDINLKEIYFSQKEKNILIKENEFEYKINAEKYYEAFNFKHFNFSCKLILYNNMGENDSNMLQIQLNSYDNKGNIIDALLLDQRFTFEIEYYREFIINKDFSINIKKYSVDNLLFDDDGNIIGDRNIPKIETVKLSYKISDKGKFIKR